MKSISWLLMLCMATGPSAAQTAVVDATQPARRKPPAQQVVKMMVTPAPEPNPALIHRLMPPAAEIMPGDAATLWLMTLQLIAPMDQKAERLEELLDLPLEELKREDARELLGDFSGRGVPVGVEPGFLRFAHQAARREECNWELTWRAEGFYALLPHLNGLRSLSRLLTLKARIEMKEREFDAALETLQTGYALANHLNHEAVLVQSLVGSSVALQMTRQVEVMIGQPGSPNLYWALAHLPRPLIDTKGALENERIGVFGTMPQLKDLRKRTISVEEFRQVLSFIPTLTSAMGRRDPGLGGVLLMAWMYPEAKTFVARSERLTPEQVDAMPAHQVLALYMVGSYEEWWSDISKWASLPYWQGRQGMKEAAERLQATQDKDSPLLALVPAIEPVYTRLMLVDRRIASLQCIEAIRAYAARHDGKLPAKLEDITATPAPIDPATGAMFIYEVQGNTAIINAPAPPGERVDVGWRYELTIGR